MIKHQQQVLFGKRLTDDIGFEWQLPGGWIAAGESPQQSARREVEEETGLLLKQTEFIGITNNIFSSQKHSISIYFEAECVNSGRLSVVEGNKCAAWEWKNWTEINENLYLPLKLLKQTGYRPGLGAHSAGHYVFESFR